MYEIDIKKLIDTGIIEEFQPGIYRLTELGKKLILKIKKGGEENEC